MTTPSPFGQPYPPVAPPVRGTNRIAIVGLVLAIVSAFAEARNFLTPLPIVVTQGPYGPEISSDRGYQIGFVSFPLLLTCPALVLCGIGIVRATRRGTGAVPAILGLLLAGCATALALLQIIGLAIG